jgi:molybdopterin-guanine dinucleotide biosynthesis protein A
MLVSSKKADSVNAGFDEITGIILAGGKSSRYGQDKALAEINGIRLVERVIAVMGPIFKQLIIISNNPDNYAYLQVPVFRDMIKGVGPLGGISTGLEVISADAGFFVACDMPFLNPDLVRHMVKIKGRFDAVIPRVGWRIESLHALYRKTCLPSIKQLIDSQEYQVFKFSKKIRARFLGEEEIRVFDPQLRSFFNVNTPQEFLNATELE